MGFDLGGGLTSILKGSSLFDPQGGGTQQATTQLPEQREFLTSLLGQLQGLIPQGLTPVQFQAPGASPLQQQAFGQFGQFGGLGQQGFDIAQQGLAGFDPSVSQRFLGQAQGALQQGLEGFDPSRITEALEPGRQLALRTFQRDTVPDLLERFSATSGQSGGLNRALAEAGADLSLGLGAQAAPFLGQAALQAPGQQFQGAGLAGNLSQLPGQLAGQSFGLAGQGSNFLQQLLGAGGQQRGIAGEQLRAQQQTQLQPQNILAQFGPLGLGIQGFENVITPPGPSFASQIAQIAGAFA